MAVEGGHVPELPLFRLGRRPDPLAWPPWRYMGGGRFDDPAREFRVLYVAEQRQACFAELLAALRPSLGELATFLTELPDGDPGDVTPVAGRIPADWHLRYLMDQLRLTLDQPWLDLRSAAVHELVRREMAREFHDLGLTDFDLSDTLSRDRRVTQAIARWAHEHGYQAIAYKSRLDAAFDCWALLEGARFTPVRTSPILRDDPDLIAVARLFHLELGR